MGFSFIGLGVSLALIFIAAALIYYFCCRKKRAANRGPNETTRQGNFVSSGPQANTAPYPTAAAGPVGWNVDATSGSKTAPYPAGGAAAPYPTGNPSQPPYPSAVGPTAPGSGWSDPANPSAPPPYSSSPPPYPG